MAEPSGFWGEQLDGAPSEGERSESASPSDSDDGDQLATLQEWHRQDSRHWHEWRTESQLCYDYVAGHQWDEADRHKLTDSLRPVITFNRIGPFADSVSGMEIQNRQETRYIPRTLGKSGVAELETAAAKWCRDECDAEDEESDAFLDVVICGIGVTQTNISYDDDPAGQVWIERRDPLMVKWDSNSRKRNFADARRVFYEKDVPIADARDLFPDRNDWELDAVWAKDAAEDGDDPHNRREAPFYRNDQSGHVDKEKQKVRMVECEWWEYEKGYRVWDPTTKREQKVSLEQHDKMQGRAKQLNKINPAFPRSYPSVKYRRKVYYRAILGAVILLKTEGADKGGFTLKGITGKRDRKHNTYYGLVRAMIDPQQWANKWMSQVLHIINTNAKGGLLAEKSAFENPHEAEDTWADPSAITLLRDGALSGPGGPRVQPKPMGQYPQGVDRLMQFAIESIPGVTGISPEMMAQVDRNQPGVLEMQRKQQGMTILAGFFDALRRYRKEQGRLLLWLIQTFISDGRLIRVGGPEDAQYVPLVRDPNNAEYDVVVDDTPSSPNMKERVWGALVQMMPMLARFNLPPTALLKLFEYSPLPAGLVAEVSAEVQKQMQVAGPGGQQMQVELADKQAQISERNARAQMHQASAAHRMAEASLLQQESGMDASLKQAQIENTRASAAASLTKAGVDHMDTRFGMLIDAVDALLKIRGAMNPQPPMQPGAQQSGPPANDNGAMPQAGAA